MSARDAVRAALLAAAGLLAACATPPTYDYTNLRQSRPRSILVLPPLNNSTDVRGTYGYLSTVTRPLAELGYYVFPVALVDQFLKENGLPGPGEMHQAPLDKLASIFGADSVLYVVLDEYGTKYHLISSATIVRARAKLVDAKTGLTLWEGAVQAVLPSGNSGGGLIGALVEAAVNQAVASTVDRAHGVSRDANALLFTGKPRYNSNARGAGAAPLLYGPYRPEDEASAH